MASSQWAMIHQRGPQPAQNYHVQADYRVRTVSDLPEINTSLPKLCSEKSIKLTNKELNVKLNTIQSTSSHQGARLFKNMPQMLQSLRVIFENALVAT